MDTNEFAAEAKQSLSNLSLCAFKIARWLKSAYNILDRSHVGCWRLLRRTSPLLHLSQDWRKSTCKQQWRGPSTVARLAADLGPPSKRPERTVKGLAAWALKSYLNVFVSMFCSFCFVFPSVCFLFYVLWVFKLFVIFYLFLNFYYLLKIGRAKAPPALPAPPSLAILIMVETFSTDTNNLLLWQRGYELYRKVQFAYWRCGKADKLVGFSEGHLLPVGWLQSSWSGGWRTRIVGLMGLQWKQQQTKSANDRCIQRILNQSLEL